ncbi:MAG: DUF3277 family protein [Oscillospiraceae bacterium]|nr:DUF3277 family protein [Oscillospiraceae bacterium]
MNSTYSFEDMAVVIAHPGIGQLSLQGEGLGSITFAMANDMSQHDLAADGSVMTSKISAPNGTITIQVQQTSDAAKWLRRYINYVKTAAASEFAQATVVGSSKVMGVTHTCTGVSPQKRPDASYQQAGQQLSVTLLAAQMEEVA